ncbi:MAG: hypothetical protein MUQ56_01715, partial [Thermoleophilia bacterium]|nr:hypothetical protein [Thermoleophilia bacterium]
AGLPGTFHSGIWDLAVTIPAKANPACVDAPTATPPTYCDRVRAHPDGEIPTGVPIPAVVPLPGKPMAPMPGKVTVAQKVVNGTPIQASVAKVIDRNVNPGYPFWIAGIEDTVGQRPPTPPLDMANAADVARAKTSNPVLFANLSAAQADGWDGGLPRHALEGVQAGGLADSVQNRLDFSKTILRAKPVYYPEEGTDLEQAAMAFHALLHHDTFLPDGNSATGSAGFRTNGGGGPVVGAPFHNPCIDDQGKVLTTANGVGTFFGGKSLKDMSTKGSSIFTSDKPRIYKGTFLQFDAILNKVGYHYPQERIVALWQDAADIIQHQKPAEPLVFRFNTFDCMVYHNSNLVPEKYELDDFQVRTPTDIIGQHIHLPKWDLTTTDGAANGWNYEDGTLSPGTVRERIEAINCFVNGTGVHCPTPGITGTPAVGTGSGSLIAPASLQAKAHPYFGPVATAMGGGFPAAWLGARTTIERWFADPVVNVEGVDRGLGIIFTHDHYGPSSHQQIGLYATALTEPAGSRWVHNETGAQLGYDPVTGAAARTATAKNPITNATYTISDGGPTSWQAAILPPATAPGGSTVKSETVPAAREFYFEFSDFQHAYEKGVYVGAGPDGLPIEGAGPLDRFLVTADAPANVAAAAT